MFNGGDAVAKVFRAPHVLIVKSRAIPTLVIHPTLVPLKLEGDEGIHRLFQYRLILQTPDSTDFTAGLGCNLALESVLTDNAFASEKRFTENYPTGDNTVQCNESDFAFVTRLMQTDGINYHFAHSDGVHGLVLSNRNGAIQDRHPKQGKSIGVYHRIPLYPLGHKIDREYMHVSVQCISASAQTKPRATAQAHQDVYLWHAVLPNTGGTDYSQPSSGAHKAANPTDVRGPQVASQRVQALRQGGRSNHVVLEDTHGKIQAQLQSDHQHSTLSLGHINRIEDNVRRKDARSEGFELITEARLKAYGPVKHMAETTARLQQAKYQYTNLGGLIIKHLAQGAQDQADVVHVLQTQIESIDCGTGSSDKELFKFAAPHMVLPSLSGIATTTPECTHQPSGKRHAVGAAGHSTMSAGQSLLGNAKRAVQLFAYRLGIRLVSATIALISTKQVFLNGAGGSMRWSADAIEEATDSIRAVHAESYSLALPVGRG